MEIEIVLNRLRNEYYPKLYPLCFIGSLDNPIETICGDISNKITAWLNENYHELVGKICFRSGIYIGEGTEFSGGIRGTCHSWVEIQLDKDNKIIIDGAFAQFFPKETPLAIRKRVRLAIFYPQDERQKWYGNEWRKEDGKQTSSPK